jgi:Coenzyme PQQ synthesis protein D (PqqD)
MSELGEGGLADDGQGGRTAGAVTGRAERATLRPCRASGLVECDVRDELLVYAPEREIVVSLNPSGRAIWELCRGERTVAEIAEALADRLSVPAEALLPDVLDAVRRLQSLGVLRLAGPSVAPPT